MAVEQLSKQQQAPTARGTSFPGYDLASCIEVARVLHIKGGGQATPDQLAAHLGYKGTNNGAYLTKVGAARSFQLIAKVGPVFVPTALAHQILSPVYPHEARKALVDAFFNIELFKRVYDDFKGRELPPEFGMKNALRHQYGVAVGRLPDAYRSLMESADTAGFFTTKAGARTHLILPLIQPVPMQQTVSTPAAEDLGLGDGGAGGNGGGSGEGGGDEGVALPPRPSLVYGSKAAPSASLGDVKAKYLSTLIQLFEDKSKNGELDEKLMERIERLLGETTGGPQ